jgi:hypothetical protein
MDLFGKFLFGFLALLVLGLCFIVGMLPASAVEGGAAPVLIWGVVAGLIMGAFSAWMGWMFGDMEFRSDRSPRIAAAVSGIAAFVVTMWLPVTTYTNGHDYAIYARQIAPIVRTYVLENFDQIDVDHSGVITDGEMDAALSNLTFTDEQRRALEFMRSNQSEAGHVIDSYTTTTYVWITTGPNGAGYMSPIITTTYIYGVSRGDLEHYPERVIEKWKLW